MTVIVQRMFQRRGTAAEWSAANPVLAAGEIGVQLGAPLRFKIGDGATAWNSLPYEDVQTTSDLAEGSNLYYTDERALDAVAAAIAAGTHSGITITYDDAANKFNITASAGAGPGSIGCTFDGGASAITAGSQCDVLVPFNCEINKATILADQSGSMVINVWADAYGSYPPTSGDSITASAAPTISSATKSQDATLTGWSKTITAGTTIRFNVASCVSIKRATLILEVTKT